MITAIAMIITAVVLAVPYLGIELPTQEGKVNYETVSVVGEYEWDGDVISVSGMTIAPAGAFNPGEVSLGSLVKISGRLLKSGTLQAKLLEYGYDEDTPALCEDGLDNDFDGDTDCDDEGCFYNCPVPETTEALCSDGEDNDFDGNIDCADSECYDFCAEPENTMAFCSDNIDNDLDGAVDCEDTDCVETGPEQTDILIDGFSTGSAGIHSHPGDGTFERWSQTFKFPKSVELRGLSWKVGQQSGFGDSGVNLWVALRESLDGPDLAYGEYPHSLMTQAPGTEVNFEFDEGYIINADTTYYLVWSGPELQKKYYAYYQRASPYGDGTSYVYRNYYNNWQGGWVNIGYVDLWLELNYVETSCLGDQPPAPDCAYTGWPTDWQGIYNSQECADLRVGMACNPTQMTITVDGQCYTGTDYCQGFMGSSQLLTGGEWC